MHMAQLLWYCTCFTYTLAWANDILEETQKKGTSMEPLKQFNVKKVNPIENLTQKELDKYLKKLSIVAHNNKNDLIVDDIVRYNNKDKNGARKQGQMCTKPSCSDSYTTESSNIESRTPPCGGLCVLKKGNTVLRGILGGLEQRKYNMPPPE
uniref:Uncharacterized protein n=1 Tax=Cuerna arida TaxID=1464854 RepID=A0A1B6F499_9HEMI